MLLILRAVVICPFLTVPLAKLNLVESYVSEERYLPNVLNAFEDSTHVIHIHISYTHVSFFGYHFLPFTLGSPNQLLVDCPRQCATDCLPRYPDAQSIEEASHPVFCKHLLGCVDHIAIASWHKLDACLDRIEGIRNRRSQPRCSHPRHEVDARRCARGQLRAGARFLLNLGRERGKLSF